MSGDFVNPVEVWCHIFLHNARQHVLRADHSACSVSLLTDCLVSSRSEDMDMGTDMFFSGGCLLMSSLACSGEPRELVGGGRFALSSECNPKSIPGQRAVNPKLFRKVVLFDAQSQLKSPLPLPPSIRGVQPRFRGPCGEVVSSQFFSGYYRRTSGRLETIAHHYEVLNSIITRQMTRPAWN